MFYYICRMSTTSGVGLLALELINLWIHCTSGLHVHQFRYSLKGFCYLILNILLSSISNNMQQWISTYCSRNIWQPLNGTVWWTVFLAFKRSVGGSEQLMWSMAREWPYMLQCNYLQREGLQNLTRPRSQDPWTFRGAFLFVGMFQ